MSEVIYDLVLDAKDAISRHVRWKITLHMAVRMREPLNASAVNAIDQLHECSVGAWIVSLQKSSVGQTPELHALDQAHRDFHREMKQVADLINRQAAYEAAEVALRPGSSFDKASKAITGAITTFDRIQKKTAPKVIPSDPHTAVQTKAIPGSLHSGLTPQSSK